MISISGSNIWSIALLALATMAIVSVEIFRFSSSCYSSEKQQNNPEITSVPKVEGTTGHLFNGEIIRKYHGDSLKSDSTEDINGLSENLRHDYCHHWSVVTTIFQATDAVKHQGSLPGWCLVVVGDKKSPPNFSFQSESTIFLSVERQILLGERIPFVKNLPWNHFGRKNVGYIFAILNGAKYIWDFDDDNMLITTSKAMTFPSIGTIENMNLNMATKVSVSVPSFIDDIVFNPYPSMGGPPHSWPRGFPLDRVKKSLSPMTFQSDSVALSTIGVIQSLADHDPDVDAIYRMTSSPLPFNFNPDSSVSGDRLLVVPSCKYSPYNAQATLHFYSALWSLFLPVTVHGRVSDIWRGYVFQRLAKDCNLHLAYSPSIVRQDRNAHNYLADFDSEDDLYKRSGKLIEQLESWQPGANLDLPDRIIEIYIFLYERGYIEELDVVLIQEWIRALKSMRYVFPYC